MGGQMCPQNYDHLTKNLTVPLSPSIKQGGFFPHSVKTLVMIQEDQ